MNATMDDPIKRWTVTTASALEHALINRFGTLGQVRKEFLLRSDTGVRHGPRTRSGTMAPSSPVASTRRWWAATA
ncbi:hypothetical protein RSP03_34190 [Cereibacter sphaeroides]|nr:hypothetical protein RSP03_34190 [Cereibacter sphaeroides]